MHITTVSHTLHFLIGQIQFMRQAGFDVETVSAVNPGGDEKLDFFIANEPVPHHEVNITRTLSPGKDLVATWRLFRLLRAKRPEIVHAHTPKAGLLGMLAAFSAGVPVRVYHIHGLRFSTLTGWKRSLVIACESMACQLATKVLCVSESARCDAANARLASRERIKVLLNGSINGLDAAGRFDPDHLAAETREATRARLGIPEDAVVVGFVGRLVRDKGIEELVDAWGQLKQQCPDAHLLLVGDFESQDPVSDATRLNIAQDARIHHVPYDANTPPLFAAMDIFCLPSYREGLPYVALEASAMRLPIVTTNATGCVDAVEDGMTGTTVSVGDSVALAAALVRYIDDRALRLWHGTAGRRHILRSFQPSDMWNALLDEYRSELVRADCVLPVPNRLAAAAPRRAA